MRTPLLKPYKMMNERRFPRLKATYLMHYWQMHEAEPDTLRTVNTKDISAGGLRFVSDEKIKKGTVLRIQLLIPPLLARVQAFAQVTGVRRQWPAAVYHISLAFIEITDAEFELLSRFIGERLSSRESDFLFDRRRIAVRNPAEEKADV